MLAGIKEFPVEVFLGTPNSLYKALSSALVLTIRGGEAGPSPL